MKKVIVLFLVGFISYSTWAQSERKTHCGDSKFSTDVLSITELESGCVEYILQVNSSGKGHALSHYTVEVPKCASIQSVENSEGWKIEYGKDPKTDITGFKIDDIHDFGEDGKDESFTVRYVLCAVDCDEDLTCAAPLVAYKAARHVDYEQLEVNCENNELLGFIEKTDATCLEGGSLEVIIESGVEPYTYEWSNGETSARIEGLAPDAYEVLVKDAAGSELLLSSTIESGTGLTLEANLTDASCNSNLDGAIDLTAIGGTAPYSYNWSTTATTEDLSGLPAGTYLVSVSDANGCTADGSYTISSTVNLAIVTNINRPDCNVQNGSISVVVTGGSGEYTYEWSTGATGPSASDLGAGTYSIAITDGSCTVNRSFVLNEDNPIKLEAAVTKTNCLEDNSGAITVIASGGAEPYSYLWDDGSTGASREGLAAGWYEVDVTDANGCSDVLRTFVNADVFQVGSNITGVSCEGDSNGSIVLTPSGGVEPYTIEWSNGLTGSTISGLTADMYGVTITDATGCSRNLFFFVPAPEPITITSAISNETCVEGNFNAELTVTGGTAPYTYSWSNGESSSTLSGLSDGSNFEVLLTDAAGCTASASVSIGFLDAGCQNDNDDSTDQDGGDDTGGDNDGGDNGGDDDNTDGGSGDDGDTGNDDGGDDDSDGDSDDGNDGGNNDDEGGNCENPYTSDIELVDIDENCFTYRAIIQYNGSKSYGLSHVTFEPSCGTVKDVTNSKNWNVEYGKDPTTGLTGFKIDNISGFGEGHLTDEFEITYTVCSSDEECKSELENEAIKVGYKFGQCSIIDGQQVEVNLPGSVRVWPNPFRNKANFEFVSNTDTRVEVLLFNNRGHVVKTLYKGQVKAGELNKWTLEGSNLGCDVYTYQIITEWEVFSGRVIKY